ncbi:membrane protein [Candidatus Magnetomorum sp. HK-1]|nr:membrane protein [Candidatus Magnetomorum sp. HK-1]
MLLILLHITIFILYIYFSGVAIVGLVSTLLKSKSDIPGKLYVYPVIGYCASLVLFRLGYPFFVNSRQTFFAVFCVLIFINFILFFVSRKLIINNIISFWKPFSIKSFSISKEKYIIIILLIFSILYISWPYLYIGEGNYYHSGNGDYFARHDGSKEFLHNTSLALELCYFKGKLVLQYISQAFWTIALQTKNPMDPFMIQSIVNLLMTVFGQFWLLRFVFHFSFSVSMISSLCMIISNLYFTTYLAGHIGSMMYGAVAPYFLGLSVLWIKNMKKMFKPTVCTANNFFSGLKTHVFFILSSMLYVFVQQTYPGPIKFLIIPLIAFAVYELIIVPARVWDKVHAFYYPYSGNQFFSTFRLKQFLPLIVGIIILLCAVIFTWEYFESKRIHNILRGSQQTWLISQTINMLMIFWGMFASDLVGCYRLVVVPHNFITLIIFILSFVISIAYCSITIYGVYLINQTKTKFFSIFTLFWVFFFVMMKYFYGSPYYLYKFYYVNFFLIIPCFIVGSLKILRVRNFFRWISYLLILFFFSTNISFNINRQIDINNRVYHQTETIKEILNVLSDCPNIYMEPIMNSVNATVFKRLFKYNNVDFTNEKKAEFILKFSENDIVKNKFFGVEGVFSNELCTIYKPLIKNKIILKTSYSPENTYLGPIRWIADRKNEMKIRYGIVENHLKEILLKIPPDILKQTYFDVRNLQMVRSLNKISRTLNIKLKTDPDSAKYFLRLKRQYGVYYNWDYYANKRFHIKNYNTKGVYDFFYLVKNESVVLENLTFVLSQVPHTNRVVKIGDIDKSAIISMLKGLDESVYLDFSKKEPLYFFLKHQNNINISTDPSQSNYFLLFELPPQLESFKYHYYLQEPDEKLIKRFRFKKLPIGLKLVKISNINRKRSNYPVPPLDYLSLFYQEILDPHFTIKIENIDYAQKMYLNIIIAPGPGIDNSPFKLNVENHSHAKKTMYDINSLTYISHPVLKSKDPGQTFVFIGKDLAGKRLKYDYRILCMMLMLVELSDSARPSDETKRILETNRKFF